MSAADDVLVCLKCGLPFVPVVGQVASGAVSLIQLAAAHGWLPWQHGHVDPACARALGIQSGLAAAVSSAVTSEREKEKRMVDHSAMRLGRKKVRIDPRTLKIEKYLAPALLANPPARVDWSAKMTDIGVMANDVLGCCTIADWGHFVQAATAENGAQVIIPDAAIVAAYSAVGNFVLGDPSTDQGCIELDVMNYIRKVGVGGHQSLAFASVDPKNQRVVELVIDMFGGAHIGLDLPISAQTQEVWAVPAGGPIGDGTPRSWGGHEVVALNYGPLGLVVVTWGALKTMTWDFLRTYCPEIYAVLSTDWANGKRPCPSGFLLADLQTDLAAVAG